MPVLTLVGMARVKCVKCVDSYKVTWHFKIVFSRKSEKVVQLNRLLCLCPKYSPGVCMCMCVHVCVCPCLLSSVVQKLFPCQCYIRHGIVISMYIYIYGICLE